ncbi:MAG: ABC transporter permease subunit [Thermoanaerobaculia bacterium]
MPQALYQIARADFLERVRRYGFLVTMAAAVYLGYAVNAGTLGMSLGNYRGEPNSAWIGLQMAMITSTFVSLVGFYVIKNAVERDRQTRVGQIIAATPVTKATYLLGKFLSNFAVLGTIVLVMAAGAFVMQLLGHGFALEPWPLLSPFLLLALPMMAITAAVAVVFETVGFLSGGFGNVAYFFFWGASLAIGVQSKLAALDPLGFTVIERTLLASVRAAHPDWDGGFSTGGGGFMHGANRLPHLWSGISWTAAFIGMRLAWFAVAAGIVCLGTLFFDRFDSSRAPLLRRRGKAQAEEAPEPLPLPPPPPSRVTLTPIPKHAASFKSFQSFRFGGVLMAEVRLLLQGQRWWWYAGAVGLLIAQAANPLPQARHAVLALSWLWPILLWSAMGTRELKHGTDQLLFSSARSLSRQLPALWLAGVLLALLTGSVVGVRLALAGDRAGVQAWLAGAIFIPSLALALGVVSGSSKLFEGLYTTLWYIGPIQGKPERALDFLGAAPEHAAVMAPVYLGISAGLAILAFWARSRRMVQ